MTTAGPFPTKPMFEQLKTQVQGAPSPWAFQDHYARDVADATTEGYTTTRTGALSIIPSMAGAAGMTALGALFIDVPVNWQGSVDATFPQEFPVLGEFEVRLGVDQTDPAVQGNVRFLLLSTTAQGAEVMVTFDRENAWTADGSAAWPVPLPVGAWATVRVRITAQGVTFTGPGGAALTLPLPAGWQEGAAPWQATVQVTSTAVPDQQAWGAVDVLAWRPLDTGPM